MPETEAQRRANVKWRSKNVRRMTVAFYPKDAELVAWMDRRGHKGAWLADLARREFERERNRGETRGTFELRIRIYRLRIEDGRVVDTEIPDGVFFVDEYDTLEEAVEEADRQAAPGAFVAVDDLERGIGAVQHEILRVTDEDGDTVYERDALDARPDIRSAWREAVHAYYAPFGVFSDDERKTVAGILADGKLYGRAPRNSLLA